MKKTIEEKLAKIVNQNDALKLFGVVVLQTDQGYELFNGYKITFKDDRWAISSQAFNIDLSFYELKNAVTFCVFHSNCMMQDANKIREEDRKYGNANTHLKILKHLRKKYKKSEKVFIYTAKMTECESEISGILPTLQTLWEKSRSIQMKKFSTTKLNTI